MDSKAAELIQQYSDIAEIIFPQIVTWLLDVSAAIGILVIGWIAASLISRIVRRLLGRNQAMDPTIKPFLANLVRYTILAMVLFAAISQIGVETASILAVLGAAGLAIGLALQGTLANVAAGVMLLILRPLRVDEFIDVGGSMGTVREVGLFSTMLHSFDGLCVYIPNAQVWGSTIINYSRLGRRRFDVSVGIAYEDDIDQAIGVLQAVLEKESRVLDQPAAPEVFVAALGDNAVVLTMRAWTRSADYLATVADMKRAAKYAMDRAGITIPFPQRTVHIAPGSAIQMEEEN